MAFLPSVVTVVDASDGVMISDGSVHDLCRQLSTIIDDGYRRLLG